MSHKKFTIHVSSYPTIQHSDNSASDFTAILPETLNLRGEWKVALSQIVLPSKMKILPSLDFRLEIEDVESNQTTNCEFPSMVHNYEDLMNHFKDQVKIVADVDTLSTGNIVLKFKKKVKMKIGAHLAYLLGHIDSLKELYLSNVTSSEDSQFNEKNVSK